MTEVFSDEIIGKNAMTSGGYPIGTVEDIANCVAWLAGDQSSYVTGQVISVNGGMV